MEVSSCEQMALPPRWDMSRTFFGMYGTKRKFTFTEDEEPHDQFCPVAKKVCPLSEAAMDDDCLPEASFQQAITHQPFNHQVLHMSPSLHQHQRDHMGPEEKPQPDNAKSPKLLSWQDGRLANWSAVMRSCQGGANADVDREGWAGEAGRCQGGGAERLRWGGDEEEEALPSGPRVEIDQDSNGCWQSPENLRKQLEKQIRTPELEQARQESLRAKADKLKSQLQYMKSMEVESNDYWALPQENCLKMEDELEQARIAMESDYVPDPYQYHCSDIPVPMAGHDAGAFNQVRCYCKPNWEGMLDPVGYI